ncbi:unnamed protein product [Leptosia nina]|uniref:Uncharacterized protein n=1 Tax=Leptosia nina TaxID=320188 RepID=A0AAV1JUL6_9NEOP
MPKEIATFLNLPEAQEYTEHSFRRSLINTKRNGGWRSSSVAEGYIDDSLKNKEEISSHITRNIQLEFTGVHTAATASVAATDDCRTLWSRFSYFHSREAALICMKRLRWSVYKLLRSKHLYTQRCSSLHVMSPGACGIVACVPGIPYKRGRPECRPATLVPQPQSCLYCKFATTAGCSSLAFYELQPDTTSRPDKYNFNGI